MNNTNINKEPTGDSRSVCWPRPAPGKGVHMTLDRALEMIKTELSGIKTNRERVDWLRGVRRQSK
ncbi:MAG TPA: hypothetical protein PLE77_09015 [Kiritimatiellia bacterium]|nr:hypothetical protein [Kiritimatiellia bacterium]